MSARILVVEDDEDLRVVLADNLEDEGYAVLAVATVAEAEAALGLTGGTALTVDTDQAVDLVLLDVMLPDGDGYNLCRRYRKAGGDAPVLMLTARRLEDDLVTGLEAGADDYLAKPYRLRELLARVKALLRRRGAATADIEPGFGAFHFDHKARLLVGVEGPVALTRTEYDLMAWLAAHAGSAHSRDTLLDAVWGADVVVDPRTVDNFVMNLKRKLAWTAEANWRIAAVRGVGYRFEVDPA
jgi:DNA-binding response OmpR family regulator